MLIIGNLNLISVQSWTYRFTLMGNCISCCLISDNCLYFLLLENAKRTVIYLKLLGYQVLSPFKVEVARFPIGFPFNFSIFQSPPRPSFNITCSLLFF